jgi:hypothetical protein
MISRAVFGSSVIKINAECGKQVQSRARYRFAPGGFASMEEAAN